MGERRRVVLGLPARDTFQRGGGRVAAKHDHRIAMAFLVLGALAREAVAIDDGAMIGTSFPGFVAVMNEIGANISPKADATPAIGGTTTCSSPRRSATPQHAPARR